MNEIEIAFMIRLVAPIVLIAAFGGLVCIIHDGRIVR